MKELNTSVDNFQIIPLKERKRIRDKKIKALYRVGLSIEEVVSEMLKLGYSVSKTTVFYVLNGRWTKKAAERRRIRKSLLKNNTIK